MKKAWQACAAIPLTIALAACGGGGGGGGSTGGPPPPTTFDLQAGMQNLLQKGLTTNVSLTGTVSNITVTGSGTYQVQPGTPTTFNGGNALSQATSISGSVDLAGTTQPYAAITINYYSASDAAFLGETGQSSPTAAEYDVAGTPLQWPTSLVAGASGDLGKVQRYTDSTQSVSIGSADVSYSAMTSGSGLQVTITIKISDASGNLQETDETAYNLSTSNVLSLVSYSGQVTGGSSLTFTAD